MTILWTSQRVLVRIVACRVHEQFYKTWQSQSVLSMCMVEDVTGNDVLERNVVKHCESLLRITMSITTEKRAWPP